LRLTLEIQSLIYHLLISKFTDTLHSGNSFFRLWKIRTPRKNSKWLSSLIFRDITEKLGRPLEIYDAPRPTNFCSDIYIRDQTAGCQSFAKCKQRYLLKICAETLQRIV
jgi:hypothetical protein